MVERYLAKVEIGVRFSVPAPGFANVAFLAAFAFSAKIWVLADQTFEIPRIYRIVCILFTTYCSRSEMDITTAFEAVIGGSNPSGSTE